MVMKIIYVHFIFMRLKQNNIECKIGWIITKSIQMDDFQESNGGWTQFHMQWTFPGRSRSGRRMNLSTRIEYSKMRRSRVQAESELAAKQRGWGKGIIQIFDTLDWNPRESMPARWKRHGGGPSQRIKPHPPPFALTHHHRAPSDFAIVPPVRDVHVSLTASDVVREVTWHWGLFFVFFFLFFSLPGRMLWPRLTHPIPSLTHSHSLRLCLVFGPCRWITKLASYSISSLLTLSFSLSLTFMQSSSDGDGDGNGAQLLRRIPAMSTVEWLFVGGVLYQ